MMTQVLAELDAEDRQRWLILTSRVDALEHNPRAYSAKESEDIYMAWNRFFMDVCDKYVPDRDGGFVIGRSGRILKDG